VDMVQCTVEQCVFLHGLFVTCFYARKFRRKIHCKFFGDDSLKIFWGSLFQAQQASIMLLQKAGLLGHLCTTSLKKKLFPEEKLKHILQYPTALTHCYY
jgi:hypothetical protein